MGELNGKAALVTGASRGIGKAVALRLASDGAAIYLASRAGDYVVGETIAVDGGIAYASLAAGPS